MILWSLITYVVCWFLLAEGHGQLWIRFQGLGTEKNLGPNHKKEKENENEMK